MAQLRIYPQRDDLPRAGLNRSLAGLSAVSTLLTLNAVTSQPSVNIGTDPTKATCYNEFIYRLSGQLLRMQPSGDIFDLTGLTPVQPGFYQKYFFLVDRDENTRVQEAVQAGTIEGTSLANIATIPYQAVVEMLNAVPGWCPVGGLGLHIRTDAASAWVPGVDAISDLTKIDQVDFIDGFDARVFLPTGEQPPSEVRSMGFPW
jgi:hypothetical protein